MSRRQQVNKLQVYQLERDRFLCFVECCTWRNCELDAIYIIILWLEEDLRHSWELLELWLWRIKFI